MYIVARRSDMVKKKRKEHRIVAAALLVVILMIVGASGCVSPTSPSPTPTPHDALLEGLVAAEYNQTAQNATITTWQVVWNNSTTVSVQFALKNQTQNIAASGNRTFIRFASTDAATSFVNSSNLTGYSLTANVPISEADLGGSYENVTGHPPAEYKVYAKTSGDQYTLNVLEIAQADDVIAIGNVTTLRTGVGPTSSPLPSVLPAPTPTPEASLIATPTPEASLIATPLPSTASTTSATASLLA
ncbi:MAG: hypothetical protein ACXVI8_04885 [Halobacteriota archaeon]